MGFDEDKESDFLLVKFSCYFDVLEGVELEELKVSFFLLIVFEWFFCLSNLVKLLD